MEQDRLRRSYAFYTLILDILDEQDMRCPILMSVMDYRVHVSRKRPDLKNRIVEAGIVLSVDVSMLTYYSQIRRVMHKLIRHGLVSANDEYYMTTPQACARRLHEKAYKIATLSERYEYTRAL